MNIRIISYLSTLNAIPLFRTPAVPPNCLLSLSFLVLLTGTTERSLAAVDPYEAGETDSNA